MGSGTCQGSLSTTQRRSPHKAPCSTCNPILWEGAASVGGLPSTIYHAKLIPGLSQKISFSQVDPQQRHSRSTEQIKNNDVHTATKNRRNRINCRTTGAGRTDSTWKRFERVWQGILASTFWKWAIQVTGTYQAKRLDLKILLKPGDQQFTCNDSDV